MNEPTLSDDEALLKECRERLQMCIDAEKDNRTEAIDDLRFGAGQQWPEEMRRMREVEARPCLTINKLPAFLHQVTNDQRQNRPSIKVHPVDDGADEETAEVIQGLIRHIEYNSNADVAYDTAVNSAAAIGFGFFRLVTEYVSEDSFDKEIKFKRIRNPFTVYIDPTSTEPDGSDMRFCFITEELSEEDFERDYPKAQKGSDTSLMAGTNDVTHTWLSKGKVRVAEYMRIEEKPATLYRLPDGTAKWGDELPIGLSSEGLPKRESKKREVWWYKVTGTDVLERTKIDCNWIPVFPVYGDEFDIDGKIVRSGLIRHAKDSQKMYNFWMTSATEEVSLRPKTPYIGAEGQFDGYEDEWSQANTRSFSYLTYVPKTVDGQPVPAPQRQPMADVPVGTLQMAMHASDNIKATTGIFDASLGAKSNETSGRAIMARQREGDVGNFHYSDNLVRTIRHAGRCILWMMRFVYDTPRLVRIMGMDDQMSNAQINQPLDQPEVDEKTGAIKTVLNDVTVACYDVVVAAGPSYTTLRQESAAAMVEMAQGNPALWQVIGDLMVKSMDWPGAEEIAERLKKTIPPQLLENEEGDEAPIPPQAQAQIQQLHGAVQQLSQALETAHSEHMQLEQEHKAGLEKQQITANTAIEVAHINADKARDVEEIKGMVAQLLIQMQPAEPFVEAAEKEPEAKTSPPEPKEDQSPQLLAQLIHALNPPRKKKMTIQAPSGAVYQGDITEEPHMPEAE